MGFLVNNFSRIFCSHQVIATTRVMAALFQLSICKAYDMRNIDPTQLVYSIYYLPRSNAIIVRCWFSVFFRHFVRSLCLFGEY